MSVLSNLVKSLDRKEVLLPRLRAFLRKEDADIASGKVSHKACVITDARLTIQCMRRRIAEFNHGVDQDILMFHPSALGTCLRRIWFSHFGALGGRDDEDPFRQHMIFETGDYVGIMFQNLCSRAGLLVRREIPIINPSSRIIGHADGLVVIRRIRYVLEIKTINRNQFGKLGNVPNDGNKRQLMCYMHELGIKNGLIVYLEKDRHEAKEYPVEYDSAYYRKNVQDRVTHYLNCVDRRVAPKREGNHPRELPCRWCPYTQVCFSPLEFEKFNRSLKKRETTKTA